MDQFVVFLSIFAPALLLSYLGAGRDQMLGQTRPRMHRGLAWFLALLGVVALQAAGIDWSWGLALVGSGVLGSQLGDWLGNDGWLVMRRRIQQLVDRSRLTAGALPESETTLG